jgi:hypothetical protein
MEHLRRPLFFLSLLFCVALISFGAIKWSRYRARQARLCTSAMVCRLDDISLRGKGPPCSPDVVRPLAAQPLFFLGEGKQCVAYETADGHYVLKLFKKNSRKKKQKQLEEYVAAGLIARTILPEETGLIAFVCGKQSFPLPTVTVLNKRGRIEKICLQDVPFSLQKKAQPLKQTLMKLIAEKKSKEAVACLKSVFTLLAVCREKGVLDRDGSLIRNGNIGFVDGKAILLDTGKLCRISDRRRQTLHDLNRLKPLQTWLEAACPELLPVFSACQERYKIGDSR